VTRATKRKKRKKRKKRAHSPSLGRRRRHAAGDFGPLSVELPAVDVPEHLRARLRTQDPPAHRLSDALVDVARPFVAYPPSRDTLDLFVRSLELVGQVWNATLAKAADDGEARLRALVETWGGGDEAHDFVWRAAKRKLELYPDDLRTITQIRVETREDQLYVEVASAHLRPGGAPRSR
jgi:hypothetical protein